MVTFEEFEQLYNYIKYGLHERCGIDITSLDTQNRYSIPELVGDAMNIRDKSIMWVLSQDGMKTDRSRDVLKVFLEAMAKDVLVRGMKGHTLRGAFEIFNMMWNRFAYENYPDMGTLMLISSKQVASSRLTSHKRPMENKNSQSMKSLDAGPGTLPEDIALPEALETKLRRPHSPKTEHKNSTDDTDRILPDKDVPKSQRSEPSISHSSEEKELMLNEDAYNPTKRNAAPRSQARINAAPRMCIPCQTGGHNHCTDYQNDRCRCGVCVQFRLQHPKTSHRGSALRYQRKPNDDPNYVRINKCGCTIL